jgi:hypothetical protein
VATAYLAEMRLIQPETLMARMRRPHRALAKCGAYQTTNVVQMHHTTLIHKSWKQNCKKNKNNRR